MMCIYTAGGRHGRARPGHLRTSGRSADGRNKSGHDDSAGRSASWRIGITRNNLALVVAQMCCAVLRDPISLLVFKIRDCARIHRGRYWRRSSRRLCLVKLHRIPTEPPRRNFDNALSAALLPRVYPGGRLRPRRFAGFSASCCLSVTTSLSALVWCCICSFSSPSR
jgi:hypothetical protein